MSKLQIINEIQHSAHGVVWHFVLEGLLLVLLGLLVVIYPQIIVYLFAFFFILLGLASFWAAVKVRRVVKKLDKLFDLF